MWAVKSISSVVSVSRVVASGWTEGIVVVSADGQRRCVIEKNSDQCDS